MLPIMNNEQLHIVLKPVKMRSMWQTIVGPVRSNEWGRAVWLLQRQYLETGRGLDWRYIAFHDQQDDDVVSVESMRAYMHGQIMKVNASFTCWETVSQFQPWFFPVGHFFLASKCAWGALGQICSCWPCCPRARAVWWKSSSFESFGMSWRNFEATRQPIILSFGHFAAIWEV